MKNNKTKKKKTRKSVTLRVDEKSVPLAKNYTVTVPRPRIRTDGKMGHVARTEKLLQIDYTAAANTEVFNIYQLNPGLDRSFPEGANMAKMYDRYRFTKLTYTYIPSTNTTHSGVIRFAYDEDPSDQSVPTSAKMAQMSHQKAGNVREKLVFNVPPKMLNSGGTWRRTRNGPVSGSLSAHDSGLLWIGYDFSISNYHIGDIFVEYEIDYLSNTPIDQLPEPISGFHLRLANGANILPTGIGVGNASPIPYGAIHYNTIYATLDGAGLYLVQPAYYRCTLYLQLLFDNALGATSDTFVFEVLRNATVVVDGYTTINQGDNGQKTLVVLNDFVVENPATISMRCWCNDPAALSTVVLGLSLRSFLRLEPIN